MSLRPGIDVPDFANLDPEERRAREQWLKRQRGPIRLNGHVLTEAEVRRDMAQMDAIVDSLRGKNFHADSPVSRDGGAVDWANPFEELAAREEEALRDASVDAVECTQQLLNLVELPAPLVEKIREVVLDHFRQYEETLLEFLFAAGPHPLEVMRRLFAYVKKKRASLLYNMGFRALGPLLHESHANAALRCKVLFSGLPAGWHKSASARAAMRESAKGNRNRTGGKPDAKMNGHHFPQ
jgi:hypothetical protein